VQHHSGNNNGELDGGAQDPPADDDGKGGPPSGGPPGRNRVLGPAEPDADWGSLVSSSPDGYGQIFQRDLGGNRRLFTFVIWANPNAARR
jgi:hypothetical protein